MDGTKMCVEAGGMPLRGGYDARDGGEGEKYGHPFYLWPGFPRKKLRPARAVVESEVPKGYCGQCDTCHDV